MSDNPLTEIRAAHLLKTSSPDRRAGCSCGAVFAWYGREEEHTKHVDAMIVEHFAARETGVRQETLLKTAEEVDQRWGDPTSHDVAEWMRGGAR